MPANTSDEIRNRMRNAIAHLDRYANRSGSFDGEWLDTLATIGLAEHELDMIREIVHHALRQP
jgi:hypothetical protein